MRKVRHLKAAPSSCPSMQQVRSASSTGGFAGRWAALSGSLRHGSSSSGSGGHKLVWPIQPAERRNLVRPGARCSLPTPPSSCSGVRLQASEGLRCVDGLMALQLPQGI